MKMKRVTVSAAGGSGGPCQAAAPWMSRDEDLDTGLPRAVAATSAAARRSQRSPNGTRHHRLSVGERNASAPCGHRLARASRSPSRSGAGDRHALVSEGGDGRLGLSLTRL